MEADRDTPRLLERFPFFMGTFLLGVVVPAMAALIPLFANRLPLPLVIEVLLALPALALLVLAAMIFDQDTFTGFLRRSILLGYLLKYTAIPYALSALMSTITFAMVVQEGNAFDSPGLSSTAGRVASIILIIWLWLITAASYLAGDARIVMVRRERKAFAQAANGKRN